MRVFAPGKLVLTGAYAVLEGAPAIVVATSRGATADASRAALTPTPEVLVALGGGIAPHVDAASLFVGTRKLGLGASAAILVASLGALEAAAGADLSRPAVRHALFDRARAAHAEAQGGGSGVDVAASVHGGVLRYVPGSARPVALPPGTQLSVLACATSARTSELRGHVDALASSRPAEHRALLDELAGVAERAAAAVDAADRAAFVDTVRETADVLGRLGRAAGAGIVPEGFDALAALAAREGAAFCVSGAGGGDVAAFVGSGPPSQAFLERAHALGLFLVDLEIDQKGARVVPAAPAFAAAAQAT